MRFAFDLFSQAQPAPSRTEQPIKINPGHPRTPGLIHLPRYLNEQGVPHPASEHPLLDPLRGQPYLERRQFNDLLLNEDYPFPLT